MRKIILLLILIAGILTTEACSDNAEDVLPDTSSDTSEDEQTNVTQSEESTNIDNVYIEDEMKISIQVGDKTYIASLEENETAKAFAAMLPMTVEMEDVNGNEKYFALPEIIRKETAENPGTIHAGDIMCYGEAGLVLFYETFSTSYSYVLIGHIDDTDDLEKALGSDDIQVTFATQ